MIDYTTTDYDLYEKSAHSLNPLRSWFHSSRNIVTAEFMDKLYKNDDVVVDLGCGNVLWNTKNIPVIGVDANAGSLDLALKRGRIVRKIVGEISKTGLEDNSVDIVLATEVIEHVLDLDEQLKEIKRILKPGGKMICSVPYDTNFSLWKPLFAVQCFYRGRILGEQYYKEECGHVNHFSPQSIKDLFIKHGFKVNTQHNHSFFTIFTIFEKL